MSKEHLERVLSELHEELAATDDLDDEQVAHLRRAVSEIDVVLRREREPAETLADRLREAALQLEETHPRLTHTIGRVADALAQIGI